MKHVLLTGITGGVGRELALALGRDRWNVYGICRKMDARAEGLNQLADGERWKITIKEWDAGDAGSFKPVASWLAELAPRLDAFVHLAAPRLGLVPFWRESASSFDQQWHIGAGMAARICTHLVRPMANKENSRMAFVLSSTTLGGAAKGMASYTTGKYALLGLAHAIAAEYAPRISVACFSPPAMDTNLLANLSPAVKKFLLDGAQHEGFLPVGQLVQRMVAWLNDSRPSMEMHNFPIP